VQISSKKIKIYRLEEILIRTLYKQYSPFMLNVNINGEKDREYHYMYILSRNSEVSEAITVPEDNNTTHREVYYL
jgi:hypothetical protein